MSSQSEISNPSSDHEVLVKVENVGKIFCRDFKKSLFYGFKDSAKDLLSWGKTKEQETRNDIHPLRDGEFWANKDISFELRRGECLGLVGKNGAGKTTLLKMLNGLIKPDSGSIEMRGRVSALIALGAGFNGLLTGRENIYINGSVLGLSKDEIDGKIDDIIDFAGIVEFIDAPVQTYSSGMSVRLGFAIASSMDPDVLIIDEVLAVGDSSFKVNCYNRIRDLLPSTAVIFVSHNMFDISRVSSRVMVLKNGSSIFSGEVEQGIHVYNELNIDGDGEESQPSMVINHDKVIESVTRINCSTKEEDLNSTIEISFEISSKENLGQVRARLVFFDETEQAVAEWDSIYHKDKFFIPRGSSNISISAGNVRLMSGIYRVAVIIADPENKGYYVGVEHGIKITLQNRATGGARYKI